MAVFLFFFVSACRIKNAEGHTYCNGHETYRTLGAVDRGGI